MSDQFIAEIRIFGFNFPPRGWALCNGQLMPIAQNTALFALIGVTYGGDGRTTFALPNLQGRVPLQPTYGPGPGQETYALGQSSGQESVTLRTDDLPSHGHQLRAQTFDPGDVSQLSSHTTFAPSTGAAVYQSTADTTLAPQALGPAGGGEPHNNMQPYLTVNFSIALEGIFPARS
jgi:microcystin-dependent protein